MKPAIVVIAFNRPNSLERLLSGLLSAHYNTIDVPLIISIDYQDSEGHQKVVELANNYNWPHGEKKVITHTVNLGLKKHVIGCGDLVSEYGSVIMLEDDIFVSPYFYSYAAQTLDFYKDSEEIGGVSLYNHKRNFLNNLPFETIPDNNDVFFLQIASSWGQAWTKKQWEGFKKWYDDDTRKDNTHQLPLSVSKWPKSSWLKEYIKYLIFSHKYFVYPVKSLTTNFGDSGTHNKVNNVEYQVALFMGDTYRLTTIDQSLNVYDSFFEILPDRLKTLCPGLKELDFSVDMYGTKNTANITTKYLLSSKTNNHSTIHSGFGLQMKPMLLNIVNQQPGTIFKIDLKENFTDGLSGITIKNPLVFNYFYTQLPLKKLIISALSQIKTKLKRSI